MISILFLALDKMDTDFRLFTYLRTFRAVRWTLRFMAPVIYPIEFTIVTARKFVALELNLYLPVIYYIFRATNWIACFVQPDHYADRLQKLVDFLLAELESTSLLCDSSPRPSCQFSVDDGDTKSLQNEEKNEMTSELKVYDFYYTLWFKLCFLILNGIKEFFVGSSNKLLSVFVGECTV